MGVGVKNWAGVETNVAADVASSWVGMRVGTAVSVTGGAPGSGVLDGVNVITGGKVGGSSLKPPLGARTKAIKPTQ